MLVLQARDQGKKMALIDQKLNVRVQHEQTTANLTTYAAGSQDFLQKLSSPRKAIIWSLLAREAEEDREASGLQEFWTTSSGAGVPVVVRLRDEYNNSYIVVVGTMIYIRGGTKRFDPAFVVYAGSPHGGVLRFENMEPETAQFRIMNEWAPKGNRDFKLQAESVQKVVERHLRLVSLPAENG